MSHGWAMGVKYVVGALVYEPFKSQRVGIIRQLRPSRHGDWPDYLIEFADGSVKWTYAVNLLDDLIEDHKKKYENHLKRRDDAKKHFKV